MGVGWLFERAADGLRKVGHALDEGKRPAEVLGELVVASVKSVDVPRALRAVADSLDKCPSCAGSGLGPRREDGGCPPCTKCDGSGWRR